MEVAIYFSLGLMSAVSVYRAVLLLRGGWLLMESFFWWWRTHGGVDVDSFVLLHPYAFLSAQVLGIATVLIILAGLWFFHRWARWLFVLLLIILVVYTAIQPDVSTSAPPPVVAGSYFVLMLNGVIVAMSFFPPVRDMFAIQT